MDNSYHHPHQKSEARKKVEYQFVKGARMSVKGLQIGVKAAVKMGKDMVKEAARPGSSSRI